MVRIALAAVCLAGCATIFAGGPDEIPVNTNPPGAYVYVNGKMVGQTPLMVSLDRHADNADIRIWYPGFQAVQLQRYKSFNYWVLLDFPILALIVPEVLDFVTGNWQEYDDDAVNLGLTPGQSAPPYGIQPQMPQQQAPVPQPTSGIPAAPAPYPQQPR